MNQLLTIREATKWAAMFLQKQVSTSNISYLIQYGRIRKFGENGEVLIDIADLEHFRFQNIRNQKQQNMFIDYIHIRENLFLSL
jgi:hypothetical protein